MNSLVYSTDHGGGKRGDVTTEPKAIMLRIADDYDRLAEWAEKSLSGSPIRTELTHDNDIAKLPKPMTASSHKFGILHYAAVKMPRTDSTLAVSGR